MLSKERLTHVRTKPAVGPVRSRRAALGAAALVLILVSASVSAFSSGSAGAGSRGAGSRGAGSRHGAARPRRSPIASAPHPSSYGGEPELAQGSSAPPQVRNAAVRFVRDYEQWSKGRLARLPAGDATARVIALLERRGRVAGVAPADVRASVRLAPDGRRSYIVTSRVGNFIVGKRRSRWLLTSLPGD
jgi:hypothetical protein